MKVRQLTVAQKNSLKGVQYSPNIFFNPIQDTNNNWIISNNEAGASSLSWVKDLPEIDFKPKVEIPIKP